MFFNLDIPDRGITLLASRPGVGKSSVLFSFAVERNKLYNDCYSIYLSDYQYRLSFTDGQTIINEKPSYDILTQCQKSNYHIAFSYLGINIDYLIEQITELITAFGAKIILLSSLPFIGDMRLPRRKHWSDIILRMKRITDQYDVAIIIACGVSRSVESRNDKHPKPNDLVLNKEALSAVDKVLFLYPENFYYNDLCSLEFSGHLPFYRLIPYPDKCYRLSLIDYYNSTSALLFGK